ncbi:hypothetical protein VOWphi5012_095 [Vibrio phage phi50-12]|uniref:Uncharacterized protein n=1 Tax=Vibrio phage phi50-12 TaxID=2654972 RepID=A0A5P8PRI4_9CAUD|nr:transcriptional regulator [Vibrio phage phi50-12]QFR59882.1 hypothetical protein VOWphi5012_095 [Vibrio phage phi50-12]
MYNLEELIKVMLFKSEEPMSGYDISIRIATGNMHQQIYRILDNLAKQGVLVCEEIPQRGKPDKKVFTLVGKLDNPKHKKSDFRKGNFAYELAYHDVLNGTSNYGEYIKALKAVEQEFLDKL